MLCYQMTIYLQDPSMEIGKKKNVEGDICVAASPSVFVAI